ncbi:MAG: PAS domain S-box protein [Spirochaetota bacterium]
MNTKKQVKSTKREKELQRKIDELANRLGEAEETLRAIREGEVDAVIVSGAKGEQVFSLVGADSIYRLIVETMKEAAFTVTFEGNILYCNAQFGQMINRQPEQIVGRPLFEFISEKNHADVSAFLMNTRQQPVKQRLVFRCKGGKNVPAYISANLLDQPDGPSICVVANDLSEIENSSELIQQLRLQQKALRESEERYRFAIQANNNAVWDMDMTTGEVYWNEIYTEWFGRPSNSGNSTQWWEEHIHPEDRNSTLDSLKKAIDGKDDRWTCEYRFQKKDGTWAFILDRAFIARNIYGKAWRVIGAMLDMTERKRYENAILESEALLRDVINTVADPIYVKDKDSRLILANPATAALLGKTMEQIIGHTDRELYENPEIGEKILEHDRQVMQSGKVHTFEETIEAPAGYRFMLNVKAPRRNIEGDVIGLVGAATDITWLKKMTDELQKAHDELEDRVRIRTAELERRTQQLRSLALELTQTENRERKRLARILHDDLQQLLVGAKLSLNAAHTQSPENAIKKVSDLLDESIKVSRTLTSELSPPILFESGLIPAVKWLARWMKEKHDLSVHVDSAADISPDSEGVTILLFQSIRELLFNVIKHANAKDAAVSVSITDNNLLNIVVSDNGKGFDADKAGARGAETGFGIFSIKERINILGGESVIFFV